MRKKMFANFTFMDKKRVQTMAGKGFESRIEKSRWKDQQVQFVRDLGAPNPSQKLTHWKNRGVSKEYCNAAAEMLGCEPHEISAVKPIAPRKASGQKLPDGASMVIAIAKNFDGEQWAALAEAATWIKGGKMLSAVDPPASKTNDGGMVTTAGQTS